MINLTFNAMVDIFVTVIFAHIENACFNDMQKRNKKSSAEVCKHFTNAGSYDLTMFASRP